MYSHIVPVLPLDELLQNCQNYIAGACSLVRGKDRGAQWPTDLLAHNQRPPDFLVPAGGVKIGTAARVQGTMRKWGCGEEHCTVGCWRTYNIDIKAEQNSTKKVSAPFGYIFVTLQSILSNLYLLKCIKGISRLLEIFQMSVHTAE